MSGVSQSPPVQTSQIKYLINDTDMKLQPEEIEKNLMDENMRRYRLGDDDIMGVGSC